MPRETPKTKAAIDSVWEPILNYVLVQPVVQKETKGGLLLPDTVQNKNQAREGVVLKVGPGTWNEDRTQRLPLCDERLKPGATVLYNHFGGSSFTETAAASQEGATVTDEVDLKMFPDHEILAVKKG